MIPSSYKDFIDSKQRQRHEPGLEATILPDVLKDFQTHLCVWSLLTGKAALLADCGLGKGLMSLVWCLNVIAKGKKGRALITAPLAVARQFEREGKKFGIPVNVTQDGTLKKGINVTNYERLKNYRPEDFDGVVCDECFPPDTPVDVVGPDNSSGKRHIKDIVPGDRILNACGVDHVKAVCKRPVQKAIKIGVGGDFLQCSENHPFLTVHGWRLAKDLQPGDHILATATAVRLLRGGVHPTVLGEQVCQVLREVLLSEMADETAGHTGESPFPRGAGQEGQEAVGVATEQSPSGEFRVGEDEEPKGSGAGGRSENDGYEAEERDAEQVPRSQRRQRQGSDRAGEDNQGRTGRGLGVFGGSPGQENSGLSDTLQSGLRQSREDDRHRDRRALPSRGGAEGAGQEEGGEVTLFRVDSVEVQEQGNPELERHRDESGALCFYDIEVARHPSFSVKGMLVHNCSILKNFDGKLRRQITDFMSMIRFRLLCSATPAPNDFMELGSSSEALGNMGRNQMLGMFFTNDGESTQQWRLKGHAKTRFWQWVATWARAVRRPSDLGYSDEGYVLPELNINTHVIPGDGPRRGIFVEYARTLDEQRAELKETVQKRCKVAAAMVPRDRQCIVWCHRIDESKLLTKLIPGAVEVEGADTERDKEQRLIGFSEGSIRVLVTKPKIAGFGMNWQNCSEVVYFPSHSHESFYQAIRRCWRFGQDNPVNVHMVTTERLKPVLDNMIRKERQSVELYDGVVRNLNAAVKRAEEGGKISMKLPEWIGGSGV